MSDELQPKHLYQLYENVIKEEMNIANKIYIDYRLLKHFILGYLNIFVIKSEKDFNKIYTTMKSSSYINRYTDLLNPTFHLDISLNEIYDQLKDINPLRYLNIIPSTVNFKIIYYIIEKMKERIYIMDKNYTKMSITINSFPFLLDDKTKYLIEELFLHTFNVYTKFRYIEPKYIHKLIESYDMMMLYDIEEILSTRCLEKYDTEEKIDKLINKTILSTKITNKEDIINTKSEEEIVHDFTFVERYLNSLFQFSYIPPINIYTNHDLKE